MKPLTTLIAASLLSACATTPPNSQWARRSPAAINDLDSLEMLLHHEQFTDNQLTHSSLQSDLYLGMASGNVSSTLGQPDHIEVAGNPDKGTERWIYVRKVPTMDGYYNERQIIYFEAGTVVGWELN
jgi:hypothetical protein